MSCPSVCLALLISISAWVVGCSSLGSRNACTADRDCKDDRVCTATGLCADAVRCPKGELVPPDATCEGAQDSRGDGSFDASPCDGACADVDAGSISCPAEDASCFETDFSGDCPGQDWTLAGDTRWACRTLGAEDYLYFSDDFWNREPPEVALGPVLELSGHTTLRWELTHAFNFNSGFGMMGALVLFVPNGDPGAKVELRRWKYTNDNQTSTRDERGSIAITALPEVLREQARLAILAGGDEASYLRTRMRWDIVRLAVRAE